MLHLSLPSLVVVLGGRVDFDSSVPRGPTPLRVAFHERADTPFSSCAWDFGDGTKSHERNPVHVFEKPGAYDVRFTIESRHGSLSIEKRVAVIAEAVVGRVALPRPPPASNILLVVLDDVGVELLRCYGEGPAELPYACTPTIDALAARGLLFRRAFGNPLCSPTRAQILTGRHGFRTGIGDLVSYGGTNIGLSPEHECTLPQMLFGHDSALVGKWHLTDPGPGCLQHPLRSGFRDYAGSLFNLQATAQVPGLSCGDPAENGYYQWIKTADPDHQGFLSQACCTRYATEDTIEDGIQRLRTMSWPWFLEVSLNAVHTPEQIPPRDLGPPPGTCPTLFVDQLGITSQDRVRAILEVLDRQLGRLLEVASALDPNVLVVLIGDNGSNGTAAVTPAGTCFGRDHVKGTLYQGGIRVPLLVAGPGVVSGECAAMVSAVDLFATFGDLAQVPHDAEDSVSLVPYLRGDFRPRRETVYSEKFSPNLASPDSHDTPPFQPFKHLTAIQDGRFKLVTVRRQGLLDNEWYFDLANDPCELVNLSPGAGIYDPPSLDPEALASLVALRSELAAMGVE